MAQQNRVTPFGEIAALDQRGALIGNRGSIHRDRSIVRPWQVRRWIACALEYKGWVAPKWEAGRWTALFFWDEAVALAAGHRPCALCRRESFDRWMDAWQAATGERPLVDPMDRQLHADRVGPDRTQRRHVAPLADLPDGTYVVWQGEAALVLADRLVPWRPGDRGDGPPNVRPARGDVVVLTPRCTVEVLRNGYPVDIHPSVTG